MHDPTSLNRQGADVGTQYRSVIFYTTDAEKVVIEKFIDKIRTRYKKPIVTEIKRLERFYTAEEHHQRYYEKNPDKPYCTFVIKPKIEKILKEFAAEIK
jgi:peptide-methionine (S)-S-oxide reductase